MNEKEFVKKMIADGGLDNLKEILEVPQALKDYLAEKGYACGFGAPGTIGFRGRIAVEGYPPVGELTLYKKKI